MAQCRTQGKRWKLADASWLISHLLILRGGWQHTLSGTGRDRSQLWLPRGLRPPHRGQPVLLGQLLQAHRLKMHPGGIKGEHLGKFLHVGG